MRIVRSRNSDRIDLIAHIVEHFAVIAKRTSIWKFLLSLRNLSRIDIAKCYNIFVGHLRQISSALTWADSDKRNVKLVVRRLSGLPNRKSRHDKSTSRKKRRGFQKLAAIRCRSRKEYFFHKNDN